MLFIFDIWTSLNDRWISSLHIIVIWTNKIKVQLLMQNMSKSLISFPFIMHKLFTILEWHFTTISCSEKPEWPASQCLLHLKITSNCLTVWKFYMNFSTGSLRLHIIHWQTLFNTNTADWTPFTLLTASAETQIRRKRAWLVTKKIIIRFCIL